MDRQHTTKSRVDGPENEHRHSRLYHRMSTGETIGKGPVNGVRPRMALATKNWPREGMCDPRVQLCVWMRIPRMPKKVKACEGNGHDQHRDLDGVKSSGPGSSGVAAAGPRVIKECCLAGEVERVHHEYRDIRWLVCPGMACSVSDDPSV